MNEFLHIGFDAYVNAGKILLIMQADADKVRREMKKRNIEKTSPAFWDATNGKEAKSFLLLENATVVVSGVSAETLVKRNSELFKGGTCHD